MNAFYENIKSFFYFIGRQIKYIGIADIIDILILAICLFYVYKFIRDRRAVKLAVGIAVITLLNFASVIFEMHAIGFILENFFQAGIILLIIVFQPELRSALEKMGGKPFESIKNLGGESKNNELVVSSIDAICSAVCDLARDKTGALVVIERTTKLGDFIRSGVVVDAKVSAALMKNLFFNKAALHDGAMIIRDMRIHAAGCFLPLSTRDDIDKDLGTRHRAAIGLSEVSDAIVIVVSEETGIISIALDGELKRKLNYSMLKNELAKELLQDASQKGKKLPGRKRRTASSFDSEENK